jgi:hypothetical protein
MSFLLNVLNKNGVLSTGAESKSSNEERAFDSDKIVGRSFCEYFSPLATTLRHQLRENENPGVVNRPITSLAFFAPQARSLMSTHATYLPI